MIRIDFLAAFRRISRNVSPWLNVSASIDFNIKFSQNWCNIVIPPCNFAEYMTIYFSVYYTAIPIPTLLCATKIFRRGNNLEYKLCTHCFQIQITDQIIQINSSDRCKKTDQKIERSWELFLIHIFSTCKNCNRPSR